VPEDPLRSLVNSSNALKRWAKESPYGPDSTPAKARAGLEARFLREADPDGSLPEAERLRRAECLRKAYYKDLAARSVRARRARRRKQQEDGGGDAAA
jgi:hypothetical protein